MDSDSNATSGQKSSSLSGRSKVDPTWMHVSESRDANGKLVLTCLYCSLSCKGGGINRLKQHIAGQKGQVVSCKKAPHDVRVQLQRLLEEGCNKKKEAEIEKRKMEKRQIEDIETDMEYSVPIEVIPDNAKKNKISGGIPKFFTLGTTEASKPSLKSVWAGKKAKLKVDMAVAKMIYATNTPLNIVNSPHFQKAVDAIAGFGRGYKAPSYYDLRFGLLHKCKKECQLLIDAYRSNWANSGCTLMADGWTDIRSRQFINFIVYCYAGISFIKSIDASDVVKDATTLCNLFEEVVEIIGPTNVVHLVTDNASNYAAAGKKLGKKYDHIFWSPCAAHCLNLTLKDICSLPKVVNLTSRASKVTIFVYNHIVVLSWLRKRDGWKEIVRPGMTRFATTFLTLKSLYDQRHDLSSLFTSKFFADHKLSKGSLGKEASAIVLDWKFWDDCLLLVKIGAPLIRLLRIVDADEKPSLGYVFDGMARARKAVVNIFKNSKKLYEPYVSIIDARWEKHLKTDLHYAAYFLNPAFIYANDFLETTEVTKGLLNIIEKNSICGDSIGAMKEIRFYRERLESFNRPTTIAATKNLQPDEWWRLFGLSTPLLQKLAIRILSQTSSSSGCERNWSVFEQIHTNRRNRLEHQRLNDLVYIAYNLRLQHRMGYKKRSYDPVDYASIELADFWVEEEEPISELNYTELEDAIYKEDAIPVGENQDSSHKCAQDDEIDIQDSVDILSLSEDNGGCGDDDGVLGENISGADHDIGVLGDNDLNYPSYDSTLPPDSFV